jgi:hypothetical protein
VSAPSREERIGAAVRAAAGGVQAPERLRRRLADPPPRRRRRALVPRLATAGALAAALAVGFVALAGGAPSVQEVAAAALQPPTRPAPAADPRDASAVLAEVEGVPFPNYEEPWGWTAVGARSDSVEGREAVTVIYRKGSQGAHYTIVSGDPLPRPQGGREVRTAGGSYTVLRDGDSQVVTWERDGHTCVLASRLVDAAGLLRIAAWR